jgi:hypothetical protein
MTQDSPLNIQFAFRPKRRAAGRSPQENNAAAPLCAPPPGRAPRISQVLALAIQFQEMLRQGEAQDCADLARLGGLTRERISQIMKFNWLASDLQLEILYLNQAPGERFPVSEVAVRRIAQRLSWTEQRALWRKLKNDKALA